MAQLSEFDKGRILALYQDGYAIRAISRTLGFSKSTVHLWVTRMAKEGHVTCRRRSGRPRATTKDQDESILRCLDEAPVRTKSEIKNILQLPVSKCTIRRRLMEQLSPQKTETSLQMPNQSHPTYVESLCAVDMPVPDVSGNYPLSTTLATGQDDIAPGHDRNGVDTDCLSEGPESSCHTSHDGTIDDNEESVAQILLQRYGADTDCLSEWPEGSYHTSHDETIDDNEESVPQIPLQSGCDMTDSGEPGPGGGDGEEAQNQQGPLHMCCKWELDTVVQTLTEQGAAINNKDMQGKTPLHAAIEKQENGIVSLLLCHPGLDLTIRDKDGLTPFAAALTCRNYKAAQGILDRMPTATEQYDDKGQNFLHMAIQEEDMEKVLFLLSNHMDVNSRVQDANQTTPLQLAAAAGSEMLVRSLVDAGASVDDRDARRRTALHVAAEADHAAVLSALLQSGADANASDSEGDNALHVACREGQPGIALVLLTESQLDAERANLKGRNPLHELARASKDTAAGIAELFIECMPHYPIDKPDRDGNTALLLAYMKGNGNLCHTLVRSGACLGAMNRDGITIFDYQVETKQLLHSLLDELSREPHWTEGDICLECGIKFGQSVLECHCHHCGRILCSKCSDRDIPIPKFGLNKPVSVCSICFSVLQGAS